jgi:5,10-methylenetetrahydromethanopterin reductase
MSSVDRRQRARWHGRGQEVADGIIGSTVSSQDVRGRFRRIGQTINGGTVLDAGESPEPAPTLPVTPHFYHFYENRRVEVCRAEYAARLDAIPTASRHLALHDGHLVTMNALDREYVSSGFMAQAGRAADAETWRARLAQAEQAGATELIYQPAGPDIPRELRAFAAIAGL